MRHPKVQPTPIRPVPMLSLNLDSRLQSLLALLNALVGLVAHDATTPLLASSLVLLNVALLDGGDELGELALVLGADLSKGEDGSGLCYWLAKGNHTERGLSGQLTFLWTTVPSLALPLMMA